MSRLVAKTLVASLFAIAAASPAFAANVVYSNIVGGPLSAYGELNSDNPVFGEALVLTQGGKLHDLGLTLYNPDYDFNSGSILTGNMHISFYDNTQSYQGGALNKPFLGSAVIPYDYTNAGGLPAGFYDVESFDLSGLSIHLPKNILITQQFVMTSGDSLFNGILLYNNPVVGASANYVYVKSDATPEDLYSFNNAPSQFGFYITVDPDVTPLPPAAPLPAAATGFLVLTTGLGLHHLRRKIART